jgi:uncharacterized protein YjdB
MLTLSCVYIAVLPILVDDIKISSTSDTLVIGESAQLHVTISPNDASNKKFSWEVDDKVSINQFTVTIQICQSFTSLRCA